MIPKTYSELQDKIRAKANENTDTTSRLWPQDIIPTQPITEGSTILTNWDDDKCYKAPFTVDEKSGEITLGESTEVQAITNYEAVKYARAQGSYEEKQFLIISAIQDGLSRNQYCGIYATYDDHVVVYIGTEDPVTYDYSEETFSIPYSIDDQGNVTLGTAEPVQEVKTFEAVKVGAFVVKDDSKRLVEGPVMLPGCPDCDFKRGEKIFTVEEVEEFCHKYNEFRINDDMHLYGVDGRQTGTVVENYTLKSELKTTNVLGEEVILPVGTWMIVSKVTDDETWNKIQDGTFKGYSGTYIPEEDATKLKESLKSVKDEDSELVAVKSADIFSDLFKELASTKRVLIKDIEKPVPVTVAYVDAPCVEGAIYTSLKSNPVIKAGRSISNATLDTLNKAHEKAQNALDGLKELITTAQNERDKTTTKNKPTEVLDMEEKDVQKMIDTAVEKSTKESKKEIEELKQTVESQKTELEALKKEPEEGSTEGEESTKGEGTEGESTETAAVKTEDDPVIKGILKTQNLIVEKLGIDPTSQSLNSPESTPESTATKRKSIAEMAQRK